MLQLIITSASSEQEFSLTPKDGHFVRYSDIAYNIQHSTNILQQIRYEISERCTNTYYLCSLKLKNLSTEIVFYFSPIGISKIENYIFLENKPTDFGFYEFYIVDKYILTVRQYIPWSDGQEIDALTKALQVFSFVQVRSDLIEKIETQKVALHLLTTMRSAFENQTDTIKMQEETIKDQKEQISQLQEAIKDKDVPNESIQMYDSTSLSKNIFKLISLVLMGILCLVVLVVGGWYACTRRNWKRYEEAKPKDNYEPQYLYELGDVTL